MNRRKFLKLMAGAGVAAASCGLWPPIATCFGKTTRTPRLVLLYATCSVSKFCLSPYNPAVTYTPNIAKFATTAAVFNACQTECAQSGPAYASILSGNQADRHGIFSHPSRIDDSVHLITETFAANGYDVYFWGGHPMADYSLNYGQGTKKENAFPYQLLADDARLVTILKRLATDEAYRVFILTTFSVTHFPYYPVSPPYPSYPFYYLSVRQYQKFYSTQTIQPEFKQTGMSGSDIRRYYDIYLKHCIPFMCDFEKTAVDLGLSPSGIREFIQAIEYVYKVNISRLDILFGEVVEQIRQYGLFEDSLIVFTADHGETLYRDNAFLKFSHGFQLAPEEISVPLVISAPGAGVKPAIYDSVVRSVDIAPTMSGLCGIETPEKTMGVDISGMLISGQKIPDMPAFSHTTLPHLPYTILDSLYDAVMNFFSGDGYRLDCDTLKKLYPEKKPEMMWVAVRYGDSIYKIAKFDLDKPVFTPAVFNLASDPEERRNLFDSQNSRHVKIMDELRQYKQELISAYKRKDGKPDINEVDKKERIRRLRTLGYI